MTATEPARKGHQDFACALCQNEILDRVAINKKLIYHIAYLCLCSTNCHLKTSAGAHSREYLSTASLKQTRTLHSPNKK